jgi:hypothetical protein
VTARMTYYDAPTQPSSSFFTQPSMRHRHHPCHHRCETL